MYNLFKMEFYQLYHNRIFYGMMALSIGFGVGMSGGYLVDAGFTGVGNTGMGIFGAMLIDSTMWAIVMGAIGSIILGRDFGNRTVTLLVAAGHSRLQIFLVKAVVYLLVMNITMLLFPIAGTIVVSVTKGYSVDFMTGIVYTLRVIGLSVLVNGAIFSVAVLLAVSFQDTAKTSAFTTLTIFAESMLLILFLSNQILPFALPLYMQRAAVAYPIALSIFIAIIVGSLGYILLFLGSGYLVFRRRELK